MVKLYISTPCYDAMMTMQYTISLMNLMTFCNRNGIDYVVDFVGNESLIPRARNNTLGKFIESDCTHLLFIDSDIEFPCEAVIDLLRYDKDVVCCTYPRKGFNWKRFMYSMQNDASSKETLESRGLDYTYNAVYDENNKIIKNGDFIKVKHASTGFMLIKRSIVERLNKKYTELEIITDNMSKNDNKIIGLFHCFIKDKQYLSEDYSFCERVNESGGEVWMNVNHNLNHIGKNVFRSDIKNRSYHGRQNFERQFYG
jgi:hypothetical protein